MTGASSSAIDTEMIGVVAAVRPAS